MSSSYRYGTPITLVGRSWSVNPLTEVTQPQTPAVASFKVEAPDGSVATYALGDPNVSVLAPGVVACQIDPPTIPGTYSWDYDSDSGDASDEFDVLEPGVLPPIATGVPVPGPCTPWIDGADVAAACSNSGVGSDVFRLNDVASMAATLLFELSGRQYPGVCQRQIRPCRASCSCWPGAFAFPLAGYQIAGWSFDGVSGLWDCGTRRCGCGSESYVKLPGYPVREIVAVKINGQVVSSSEYRLEGWRRLLRLSDPGPPVVPRVWPACQDISLADTESRTFSITYRYGIDPPPLARAAAAELACNLWNAGPGKGECKLPTKVTRVVRQGVTIERISSIADMLRSGSTGLATVDAFLAGANPTKMNRRPAVWSPDVPQSRRI